MKCFYPYERSVYFNRSRVGEPPFSSSVRNCENCSHFVNSESEKSNVKKWEKIRSRGRSGPAQILRESRFLNGGGENWGIFILSWPYPFPYLVNTWSPSGKKKKTNKNLWPYTSIFYCPTFICGQILPGIFGHLMFMLLLIFSTAPALAMQDLRQSISSEQASRLSSLDWKTRRKISPVLQTSNAEGNLRCTFVVCIRQLRTC